MSPFTQIPSWLRSALRNLFIRSRVERDLDADVRAYADLLADEKVGAGMGDMIPQWAGGLPANAPPRPGTPEYDRFMQERERQRQLPAAERDKETQSGANAHAAVPVR